MKTRLFVVLAGAMSLLGLGLTACTTDDTAGTGGTGGTATTSSTGNPTTSSTGNTGGTGGGTGGTGGSADCQTCSEFIDAEMQDSDNLCDDNGPPSSYDIFFTLFDCICAGPDAMPGTDPAGPCEDVCGDNLCMDLAATPECDACTADQAGIIAVCGTEATACLNDTE